MRVYTTDVPGDFEWAQPVSASDYEILDLLPGRIRPEHWRAIKMRILRKEKERDRPWKHAYLPWCGTGMLVLRDEAVEVVGEILSPHGDLLPLRCDEARLVLFAAPIIEGALDLERSQLKRFDSGKIMRIIDYEFVPEVVEGLEAFRIADMRVSDLFLSQALVERLLATGLTSGTIFTPTWDNE